MVEEMKKIPYEVKAKETTATIEEMKEVAIYAEKGIPFQSPNGKVWLVQVDDNGSLFVTEKI